jgi:hypothetical protein
MSFFFNVPCQFTSLIDLQRLPLPVFPFSPLPGNHLGQFDLEDKTKMLPQNAGIWLPNNTVSYPKNESSATYMLKTQECLLYNSIKQSPQMQQHAHMMDGRRNL